VNGAYWIDVVTCGGPLPSRMINGDYGRVTPGLPNVVRSSPGTAAGSSTVIGSIPPYGTFTIIGGPQCATGMIWWQVNYNGLVGWTAEGQNGVYWLDPGRYVSIQN
jgi:hypothetical protein